MENIVDFSVFSSPQKETVIEDDALQRIGTEVLDYLKNDGFFRMTNTGLEGDSAKSINTEGEEFYAQPMEQKEKYNFFSAEGRRGGYMGEYFDEKHAKNHDFPCEGYFHRSYSDIDAREKWPEEIDHPVYLEALEKYWWDCSVVFRRIMQCIALSLGKPRNFFDIGCLKSLAERRPTTNNSMLRHIYYHSFNKTGIDMSKQRIKQHQDWHYLTLLQPNAPGLKYQKKDGAWIDCPFRKGDIVVQAGLNMEKLIPGTYAPFHYVGVPEQEDDIVPIRQCLVFFCCPDHGTRVCGIDEDPSGKQLYIDWENQRYERYFNGGYDRLNSEKSAF